MARTIAAIKYFRAVLNLNDEYHTRQMIQHRLFEPILNVLLESMPRDNLLNSACLDLFEHIRKENIKPLIYHLVENYREKLLMISSVETFQGIILRHEQFLNPTISQTSAAGDIDSSMMTSDAGSPNTRHVTVNGGSRWQGLKDVDPDEDAYFNGSDGELDDEDELSRETPFARVNGTTSLSKPLVDYPDDEDDDEDLPLAMPHDMDLELSGSEIERKARTQVELASSPPTASSPLPMVTPPRQTPAQVPSTPPSTSLSEKRRREDDDDEDELGKLTANTAKRRNSSSSAGSHISIKLQRSSSPEKKTLSSSNTTASTPEAPSPLSLDTSINTATNDDSPKVDREKALARSPSLKRKKGFIVNRDKEKEKVKDKDKDGTSCIAVAGASESEGIENKKSAASPTEKSGVKKITISFSSRKEKDKPQSSGKDA